VSDVTVVVACFNYGAYLPEAVRSATSQGASVVVVDDGSTDLATQRALEALPSEVRVLRQANAGPAAARNAGIRAAGTPLVMALDADDRLAPGALGALRAGLEAEPAAGFAYGHQRFFGDMGGEMRFPPYDPYRLLYRHLVGPTALMRVDMLREVGGYDPAFALYEDWELWVNALAHGWRGHRVDAVTHEYRRHGGSKLARDRRAYRAFRRQLRAKHAALFARRRELARESSLGPLGRAVYRFYWGPRPVPGALEQWAYRTLLFRPQ
jgi:glycosyltransferase involved in cell wall biosynthesis